MSNAVFKVLGRVEETEHEDMLERMNGYMTAWMLYQLENDEEVGKKIIGENAEILFNANWQDIEKNN